MKRFTLFFVCLLLLSNGANAQKKLLLSGSGWDNVAILNKESKQVEWQMPTGGECNSVNMTKDKCIVFSYGKGIKMVNLQKEILWDYKVKGQGECHCAKLLKNGNILSVISGQPARIVELNQEGEEVFSLDFDTRINSMHGQFRQIEKAKDGNYILPVMSQSKVYILSPQGKILRSFPVPGVLFGACQLKDGNLIVSGGDSGCFYRVDYESGKILEKFEKKSLKGVELLFVAEIHPFKNHLFITNWAGHTRKREEARVIEINKKNEIVWTFNDVKQIKDVSAICPIK